MGEWTTSENLIERGGSEMMRGRTVFWMLALLVGCTGELDAREPPGQDQGRKVGGGMGGEADSPPAAASHGVRVGRDGGIP